MKTCKSTKFILRILTFLLFSTMPLHAQETNFENAWNQTWDYFTNTLEENEVIGGALLFLEHGEVKGSENGLHSSY